MPHHHDTLKLVRFLTSKPAQLAHTVRVGMLPVQLETLAAPAVTDDPLQAMMTQALQAGRSVPSLRWWELLEDKLTHALTQIWMEILERLLPDIDALLDKCLPPPAEQLNRTLSSK